MWTEDQAEQARGLMTRFADSKEVCAVMGCDPGELDALCREAFGEGYEAANERFAAQGRAILRKAQFDLAINGDRNMLQVLGREYLGQESAAYKPKQSRADKAKAEDATPPASDALASLRTRLKVVGGD